VTRQKQLEERLGHLDRYDVLTACLTGATSWSCVQNELAQRGKHGEDLAVLVMDVERFKYINDVFSPEVGDEMLRHLARVLRDIVGSRGSVGRLGSDEFGILYRCSAAEARGLAERVLGVLARETHIAGHDIAGHREHRCRHGGPGPARRRDDPEERRRRAHVRQDLRPQLGPLLQPRAERARVP
jgi:diguanylate cyclase (GGDEF)-like protein